MCCNSFTLVYLKSLFSLVVVEVGWFPLGIASERWSVVSYVMLRHRRWEDTPLIPAFARQVSQVSASHISTQTRENTQDPVLLTRGSTFSKMSLAANSEPSLLSCYIVWISGKGVCHRCTGDREMTPQSDKEGSPILSGLEPISDCLLSVSLTVVHCKS